MISGPSGPWGRAGPSNGCEDTDGIDIVPVPLGPHFPHGLFICQDGDNGDLPQNFKLVPLERIVGILQ